VHLYTTDQYVAARVKTIVEFYSARGGGFPSGPRPLRSGPSTPATEGGSR